MATLVLSTYHANRHFLWSRQRQAWRELQSRPTSTTQQILFLKEPSFMWVAASSSTSSEAYFSSSWHVSTHEWSQLSDRFPPCLVAECIKSLLEQLLTLRILAQCPLLIYYVKNTNHPKSDATDNVFFCINPLKCQEIPKIVELYIWYGKSHLIA